MPKIIQDVVLEADVNRESKHKTSCNYSTLDYPSNSIYHMTPKEMGHYLSVKKNSQSGEVVGKGRVQNALDKVSPWDREVARNATLGDKIWGFSLVAKKWFRGVVAQKPNRKDIVDDPRLGIFSLDYQEYEMECAKKAGRTSKRGDGMLWATKFSLKEPEFDVWARKV